MKNAGFVLLALVALASTSWAQDLFDKRPQSYSRLEPAGNAMP